MPNPMMVQPTRLTYRAKPRRRFHKPLEWHDAWLVTVILEDENYGENDCCDSCMPDKYRRCAGCGAPRELFRYVCDDCQPEAQREARFAQRRLEREALPFGEWMGTR